MHDDEQDKDIMWGAGNLFAFLLSSESSSLISFPIC